MKKVLAFLLALTLFALPTLATPPEFKAFDSTIEFITGNSECSAASINPGTYVTAYHCVTGANNGMVYLLKSGRFVGSGHVTKTDPKNDLARFESSVFMVGLEIGPKPKVGDTLFAVGFPEGVIFPVGFHADYIGDTQATGRNGTNYGIKMTINHVLIPGMSGGPIVDSQCRLIAINQIGDDSVQIGGGSEYGALMKFLGR